MYLKTERIIIRDICGNRHYEIIEDMVTIDYDKCTLVLHIPYNEPCIEDIKNTIPQRARTWDPNLKVWYIALYYFDTLTMLLTKHFHVDNIYISSNIPGSLIISNEL